MTEAQLVHMLRSTRPYNYDPSNQDIAGHLASYIQWRYMVTRIADYLEDSDPLFTRLTFKQNVGVSGDFRIDLHATKGENQIPEEEKP